MLNHVATIGTLATFLILAACSPRDEAVLERTKRAQAQKAIGGNVVSARAGAVIDNPGQRSSECKGGMTWTEIGIVPAFDYKLVQRSMKAYINAGNYACYKIGSEVQIKKPGSKDPPRGILRISKIEFLNQTELTESHAALMGMSLTDLKAYLATQKPKLHQGLANIVYFEVKSLDMGDAKPPVFALPSELVIEQGKSLKECKVIIEEPAVALREADYNFIAAFENSALFTENVTCSRVGATLTLSAPGRNDLLKKILFFEKALVGDLTQNSLSLIMGDTVDSRRKDFELRTLLAEQIEVRFGPGASQKPIYVYGLAPISGQGVLKAKPWK